ncbi:protein kinase domain-containing protein [Hyalangium rubrum]|uniref:Protein kinase n=1 Tax=Hyalangium rubrum TaxID=3103134 RepID=A0ABU5HG70_9BACT|nr:AAA family ATPase [Hyalangium sp. s54d21]MDY7232260.1 protein kinase [Hyalangium sp. s54d21]
MALTELRAAQLLMEIYVSEPITSSERASLPILRGRIDRVRELKEAFRKAFNRNPALRSYDDLTAVIDRVVQHERIQDPEARRSVVSPIIDVLAMTFDQPVMSRPFYKKTCREIGDRVALLRLTNTANAPAAINQAVSPRLTALASTESAATPLLHTSPDLHEVGVAYAEVPSPPDLTGTELSPADQPIRAPSSLGLPIALPPKATSLRALQQFLQRKKVSDEAQTLATSQAHLAHAEEQWSADPTSPSSCEAFRAALAAVAENATRLLSSVPDADRVATIARERAALAQELSIAEDVSITDRDYQRLADVGDWVRLRRAAALVHELDRGVLPAWAWPGVLSAQERGSAITRLASVAADSVLLDDLDRALKWSAELSPEERAQLAALREPDELGALFQRLKTAWSAADEELHHRSQLASMLSAMVEVFDQTRQQEILNEALTTPERSATVELCHSAYVKLADLRGDVHANVLQAVLEQIRSLDMNVKLSIETISRARERFPFTRNVDSLHAIFALTNLSFPSNSEPISPKPAEQYKAEISHPLSRQSGMSAQAYAARLIWFRADSAQQYGTVALPVRVTLRPAPTQPVDLSLNIQAEQLTNIPSQWREQVIPRVMRLERLVHITDGSARQDVEILIPITRAEADKVRGRNLKVRIRLSGAALHEAAEQELTWRDLITELPVMESPFPQNVDPDEMLQRPLGIERRFQDVLSLVKAGEKSLIIHAPRRFGKTTLLRALVQKTAALKDVIVLEDVTASGHDVAGIWRLVCGALEARLKRPVHAELEDGLLPRRDAFDQVRQEAAALGVRTIYILIDEAQALFNSIEPKRARQLSERIKERLEKSWGVRTPQTAAIRLGLVGQAHLDALVGANLLGAIQGKISSESIREEELLPVLRKAAEQGEGVQSSSDARQRLVDLAGNIWILDKLLSEILNHCRQRGRAWFVLDDVNAAADRLVAKDRNGQDQHLWTYVRDILNEANDRNDWEPSDAYPVALAWVRARDERTPHDKLQERLQQILQSWSPHYEILSSRVAECMKRLREMGVVTQDGHFTTPILERLLLNRATASDPFGSEDEVEVLYRLGLQKIRRPRSVDESDNFVTSGGQARIYRANEGTQTLAVRCIQLIEPRTRDRFIHEVTLLEKLNEAATYEAADWGKAFVHLPKLVRAGIADDDSNLGVVIYQWIEGAKLERKSLTDLAAITIGASLSSVIELLAAMEVVHRDIKPDNILIKTQTREPVLIDFGLARALSELQTGPESVAGVPEFLPPEVRDENTSRSWTTKGDVYSFGKTLKVCLKQDPSKGLRQLLDDLTAKDPTRRPTPRIIRERFDQLKDDLRLTSRLTEFQDRLTTFATEDAVVGKFIRTAAPDIWACKVGIVTSDELRVTSIASFLENCFEHIIRTQHSHLIDEFRQQGTNYLLHAERILKRESSWKELKTFGLKQEVRACGYLRNADAHPEDFASNMERAYRAVGKQRPFQVERREKDPVLRDIVLQTAGLMEKIYNPSRLRPLIEYWLQPLA